jgi:hypothetical protein
MVHLVAQAHQRSPEVGVQADQLSRVSTDSGPIGRLMSSPGVRQDSELRGRWRRHAGRRWQRFWSDRVQAVKVTRPATTNFRVAARVPVRARLIRNESANGMNRLLPRMG